MQNNKIREIRYLLSLLTVAVVSAMAVVSLLLWRYNPSSSYMAKRVLIDPLIFPQIQEKVRDPLTGRWLYYSFGFLEWEQGGVKRRFSQKEYQQFFTRVAEEKSRSLQEDPRFGAEQGRLTLWLTASASGPDRLLQEVEFAQDGGFRVRLADGTWAYFREN